VSVLKEISIVFLLLPPCGPPSVLSVKSQVTSPTASHISCLRPLNSSLSLLFFFFCFLHHPEAQLKTCLASYKHPLTHSAAFGCSQRHSSLHFGNSTNSGALSRATPSRRKRHTLIPLHPIDHSSSHINWRTVPPTLVSSPRSLTSLSLHHPPGFFSSRSLLHQTFVSVLSSLQIWVSFI